MIEKLYGKYFQKSRSFLYPLLGIKRSAAFSPSGTYVSIPGYIGPEDLKLIVSFKTDDSSEFKAFEEEMLLQNPLYESAIKFQDYKLYIFNLETYQKDFMNFLLGKYSLLSVPVKRAIKTYYSEASNEYAYMDTYLNPDKYYTVYSKLLDVSKESLVEVGELCDLCDMEKESLKIPVENMELLTKTI